MTEEDEVQTQEDENACAIDVDTDGMLTSFLSYCDDDDPTKFNPIRFADDVLANFYIKTSRDNETVYIYDCKTGIYSQNGEAMIKGLMARILGRETRHRHYTDVIFYIKGKTYFDRPLTVDPQKLVVVNGVLDVQTRQITPFSPANFYVVAVPVTYHEKAQCPTILKFLTEVVGEKLLPLIQEMFGYCLYQDYPIHVAFMFVGNGKNGKSTLQKLQTMFLGKQNVSHETLQDICYNRFSKSQLYGKLANTSADIPSIPLTYTGNFKMLTGNDPMSVEYKFKSPFSMTNIAKLIFSCNQVPETKDDTDAYYRRWQIIPCNNVFIGEKCDTHILDKLTTPEELSGLLNWALEGLKRLLDNARFSVNEDFEQQRRQYIRKSNSSKAFIEECLTHEPDTSAIIAEAELYQKYIAFCNDNGLPTSKKAALTKNIHQYLPQAKQTTERIDGKVTHAWQHISHHQAFVTSVTSVTAASPKGENQISNYLEVSKPLVTVVTNSPNSSANGKENHKAVKVSDTPVTIVPTVPTPPTEGDRVCGHCARWHKQNCTITHVDPEAHCDCVSPLNPYAQDCEDYMDKTAFANGAAKVLNGDSGGRS
jgi:putative DNA primase/helicase